MQPGDLTTVIYDRGCLRSGEEWVERNLVPVAAVAVAMAVMQVKKKIFLIFSVQISLNIFVSNLLVLEFLKFICICTTLDLVCFNLFLFIIILYFT